MIDRNFQTCSLKTRGASSGPALSVVCFERKQGTGTFLETSPPNFAAKVRLFIGAFASWTHLSICHAGPARPADPHAGHPPNE